jgi:hypothetical protein
MRTGSNPQKVKKKIGLKANHRVIVVVFIPELAGYYKNSQDVFKLCLKSLIAANKGDYAITVVNNGSCPEVHDFISNYSKGEIDTIIHHSYNIGKIDAMIGAARGAREELITLTDSDILFIKNWDSATRNIFGNFKKAGSVSPIPFRHGLFYGTSSALKQILLGRVKFSYEAIPENFEDQNKYLSSINWNNEKNNEVRWPVIEKNNIKAIVGSGHQVLTIKREMLFTTVPKTPSLTLVGGDSELKYVDEPIDKAGLMRLSTFNNYAYHIGNQVESWMNGLLSSENFKEENHSNVESTKERKKTIPHRTYIIRKHLIKTLFKIFYSE